ncbi:tetratricopeptide repeat protein [Brachyspira innocens]|uniref:tetratricopeptide repeat protein n=1 Tax=Brachyspira innocens TaxID=13264 RepID=UPI0026F01C0E|nr:tetratricopeptide repeat protein [Brachyspira innocens]MDO6993306.1 tetratricopeptide repeat protein [Brachyspira innocens]
MFRLISIVLLIFSMVVSISFAQTNEKNVYEGAQYIRNEEEAKAAYTLALYYKERALASKMATAETIKDLESAKVILLEVLKYVQNKDIYITLAETHEALGEYYQSSKIYDNLVLNNPEDTELLIKAAERNIFIINNTDKARYYLQTAYEIDPSNNDALILLGFTYYQKREFEQAVYYFNKVNENNRASNNYMQYYNFYYGMSEFYLSKFNNAVSRLNKLQNVQLAPNDEYSASYAVVKSYQALEKYNEAYSNSILIDDALFLSAYLSFMADKYNNKLFDEIDPSYPNTPKILSIIMEAETNGYSNALNMIETDLDRREIDLDIIQTYYKMVNETGSKDDKIKSEMDIISFYLMIKNIDALPKHIDNLLNYDKSGKFNNLYLQVALEFKNQNNYKSSKEMIEKYLSLDNKDIKENELVSLVLTASDIGEANLAISAAEKYEKIKYSYSYLKAYASFINKDNENTIKYLNEDFEYFSNNKSNTNDYRINIPYVTALAADSKDSALLYANYKYSLDTNSAENINSLSWALTDLGEDLDRAISLSKNAVSLEPKSPHYIDTLGVAYYKKGDYDNALRTLLKALLYIDEGSKAEIYAHIADTYYAKNDYKNALKYYRKSISSYEKEFDYDENRIKEKIKSLTENN